MHILFHIKFDLILELCPYKHDGQGDSLFVSPEMHKSLVETCRCGRPRRGIHMEKCLQRALNPHLHDSPDEEVKKDPIPMPSTSNCKLLSRNGLPILICLLISATFGLRKASYSKLEQSMQYVSPTYSMPGPRITATPYNAIIMG